LRVNFYRTIERSPAEESSPRNSGVDGVFAGLEIGPGKETGADRHVGGIQDLHPPGRRMAAGFGLKARQQFLICLLKDEGGALLVGFGEGRTLGGG